MSPDAQDRAEETDEDVLAGEDGDELDVRAAVPPDRPTVLDIEDPPGDSEGELDGPGAEPGMRISDSADDDVDAVDDEPDAVAMEATGADLSPEEGAMHRTADPPMGRDGDGYV